ncbi:H-NS histone family protein [Chitinimonas lacunae]|uniref:H-NS family nucleoid-associated regulatory protein n=1 Tax=Chitinimonas lacunae TaxID=1963018 RepID=A0ABV8MTI3_9NEIS
MTVNIDHLSADELRQLIEAAEHLRDKLVREKLASVRQKCIDLATAEGLSISELFPEAGVARRPTPLKRGSVEAKYRNPANPMQTWGGRGKRPSWFKAALAAGSSESDLRI